MYPKLIFRNAGRVENVEINHDERKNLTKIHNLNRYDIYKLIVTTLGNFEQLSKRYYYAAYFYLTTTTYC